MLVDGRTLLDQAGQEDGAIGAFNTYNLEITRAILQAAEACRRPVFLTLGTGALDFAGFLPLVRASLAAADEAKIPVAVHLDHSTDIETLRRCVQAGFTSVMIDGSRLTLEQNVALTREAVASANGIAVEAELGGVTGHEDRSGDHVPEVPMTDPDEAERFVAETGIDSLAIAIGNAHGFYGGEPRLDFERLAGLQARVSVPLVLHGASGIPDADIRRCIALGVRKINVNTEIRQALFQSLGASLNAGAGGYDVTKLLGAAIEAMQRVVEEKIRLFSAK